jgi:hypothetical protein
LNKREDGGFFLNREEKFTMNNSAKHHGVGAAI